MSILKKIIDNKINEVENDKKLISLSQLKNNLIKKNNNGPAIPSYVSAFTPFKNNRNKKVKNILASNGKTFLTLNNNNGPAVSLNSNNNNNGPVVSLNSNYKHKFRPISSL